MANTKHSHGLKKAKATGPAAIRHRMTARNKANQPRRRQRMNSKAKNKDEDIQEATDLNHLLRCFEVYGQAVCYYAQPNIALKLHEALSDYRIRLFDLSVHYTIDSIREYHYSFMAARILTGQDDPIAWATDDRRCTDLLIHKLPTSNDM